MTGLLNGRTAIITGGGRPKGIGRACARLFAEHGARVAVLDIDMSWARDAAASLPGDGHLALACDVTDKASCEAAASEVIGLFGPVDILVNNAGFTRPAGIMDVTPEDYDAIMDVILRGSFHMSQAVVPHMRAKGSGAIVNIASVAGQRGGGIVGGTHYAAAKGGVLALTKAMARELASDNVRVNAVNPSLIDTDITKGLLSDARRDELMANVPMGRIGKAEEVAGCVLFLASDLASYVTGAELDVNGGSHIH